MITANELQILLMTCYESLGNPALVENPQLFMQKLSEGILQATIDRPLPSYDALNTSTEACDVFKVIIQESIAFFHTKKSELALVKNHFDSERAKEVLDSIMFRALINQCINLQLHGIEDTFFLTNETNISWNTFKEGLSQDTLRTQRENIENIFLKLLQRYDQRIDTKTFEIIKTSPIRQRLTSISLALHSKHCVKELNQSTGPVHIIHIHSHYSPPRSAEYLSAYDSDDEPELVDSFDKTSHGLGSGIYGLAALSPEELQARIARNSKFKIIKISLPLRLIDNETAHESDQLTIISKTLQRTCDQIRNLQIAEDKSRMAKINAFFSQTKNCANLDDLAKTLCTFQNINCDQNKISTLLLETIQEFFAHAKRTEYNNIVPMPINFMIKKLGFTGIVSTINDSFNRGLIAIELETNIEHLVCMPVKPASLDCQSPRQSTQSRPWGGQLTPSSLSSSNEPPSPTLFSKASRSSSCPDIVYSPAFCNTRP